MSSDTIIPRTTLIKDLVEELISESDNASAARASGVASGPITTFRTLDLLLGGHLHPGTHILQAGYSMGKTALALQIASTCGFPALYVTTETSELELFRRLIARTTNTALERLKTGELSSNAVSYLAKQTIDLSPALAIMDGTKGVVSPQQICEVAVSLRDWAGSRRILIVIDSLQMWARPDYKPGDLDEDKSLLATLRVCCEIASYLNSPVLAVSQKLRSSDKSAITQAPVTGTAQPSTSQMPKALGDVENMAESLLELSRDKDGRGDTLAKTSLVLTIRKNRQGGTGINIPLDFTGQFQHFAEKV